MKYQVEDFNNYNEIKVTAPNEKVARLLAEQRFVPYLDVYHLQGETYKIVLNSKNGVEDANHARKDYFSYEWYSEQIAIEIAKSRQN
jgi:hypothetical protein